MPLLESVPDLNPTEASIVNVFWALRDLTADDCPVPLSESLVGWRHYRPPVPEREFVEFMRDMNAELAEWRYEQLEAQVKRREAEAKRKRDA